MPMHIAERPVTALVDGKSVEVPALKLEAFIFDVFGEATKPLVLFVDRETGEEIKIKTIRLLILFFIFERLNVEYAPLKNAAGATTNGPVQCCEALARAHHNRIKRCGGVVPAIGSFVSSLSPDTMARAGSSSSIFRFCD